MTSQNILKTTNFSPIFGPLFLCSFGTILAAKYRPPSVALIYHLSNGPLTYADFGPILAANEGQVKAAKCSP